MNKHLEDITKDGLKSVRDALAVGAVTYLLCEYGDQNVNEAVLRAKEVGVVTFFTDYFVRLLWRYSPETLNI